VPSLHGPDAIPPADSDWPLVEAGTRDSHPFHGKTIERTLTWEHRSAILWRMPPDPLVLRVKELELMNDYLLRLLAGIVNRDNPEHAYNHLKARQAEFVLRAPVLPSARELVSEIERVKGQ
jgi:hypothetical protein